MNILFAENKAGLRQIMPYVMDTYGYHLDIVSNGQEAVDLVEANQEKYDLCLMDIIHAGHEWL